MFPFLVLVEVLTTWLDAV